MSELFLKLLNMSISASWLILAVLLVRFALKKAPKWVSLLLWGIVAVRLVFPFSIESAWSLIPSAEPVSPEMVQSAAPAVQTGIPVIGNAVNPMIGESLAPAPEAGANPLQIWLLLLAAVWAIGIVGFAVYTVIVCRRLRRRVSTAVLLRDNVFQSENVGSPFVLGVLRPRIYLPFRISPRDAEHVIAHEQAHIARRDHWWKPLGFLLLAIYWFNPLVWLSYILLCRDIELACDEKVIKKLGNEQRAAYTEALLACSVNRRMIAVCPLAFGEVGVKERVKSVRNYKKPAFWIIILAVIACVVVAVCFLTNPASKKEPNEGNPDVGVENSGAGAGNFGVQKNGRSIALSPTNIVSENLISPYLYVSIGGTGYRYKRSDADPKSVTVGEMLHSFSRAGDTWSVYGVKESPDYRTVYVTIADRSSYLYEYCPPTTAEKGALQTAMERGDAMMGSGLNELGAERWKEFYEKAQKGEPCTVTVSFCRTFIPYADLDHTEYRKETPQIDVYDLSYDGETYTLKWTEQNETHQKQYKYLIPYDAEWEFLGDKEVWYTLVNDSTLTAEEILHGYYSRENSHADTDRFIIYLEFKEGGSRVFSSRSAIDFIRIYEEYLDEKNE